MISEDMEPGYSTEYIKINGINIAFMKSHVDINKYIHIMVPYNARAHLIRFCTNEFQLTNDIIQDYEFDLDDDDKLKIIGVDLI